MNTQYAVKTKSLTKVYGNKAVVSHLNMEVKSGDIYGFIGRNGSGKSTTLKMCCGLVHPTQGEISLYGSSVTDPTVRQRVGILIEDAGLYPNLTAKDNMILNAKSLGLTNLHSIDQILDLVSLTADEKKKVKHYSMGMKQRLGIAMALLGNPDLLILDEPINGLDPEGIKEVRECLLTLNKESNKTILISSHILGELSKIASRYGIIKDGTLVQQISKHDLEEQCRDYLSLTTDNTARAAAILSEHFPDLHYMVHDQNNIHIYSFTESSALTELLIKNGVGISSCHLHQMDLEQYFFELMEGGSQYA